MESVGTASTRPVLTSACAIHAVEALPYPIPYVGSAYLKSIAGFAEIKPRVNQNNDGGRPTRCSNLLHNHQ